MAEHSEARTVPPLATQVHVWHYATHSVVVRLMAMSGAMDEQAMQGDSTCVSGASHDHYRGGECYMRWTDLYNTRAMAEGSVERDIEASTSGSRWARVGIVVTVHTDPLFGNATLHYPHLFCHIAPSRVDVVNASPRVLIVVTEQGDEVTLRMRDGLVMDGYRLTMDEARTVTGGTL